MEKYSWMVFVSLALIIIGSVVGSVFSFVGLFLFGLAILFAILGLFQIKRHKNLKGKILAWIEIIYGILIIVGLILTQPIY